MTQWIEDWFGSDYYYLLYQHRGDEEARILTEHLTALLRLPAGSKIIDYGCGRGRHARCLAQKGFIVTGIDISEQNIEAAKKEHHKNLSFFIHDKRQLFRINYYDAAFSLFTSFGYSESDPENNKTVRSMAGSVRKGGWVVIDFMNAEKEIAELVSNEEVIRNNVTFQIHRRIADQCIYKEIRVQKNGKSSLFYEKVKIYGQKDFEKFFAINDLEVIHLLGDYQMGKFDPVRSPRLIILGQKKE